MSDILEYSSHILYNVNDIELYPGAISIINIEIWHEKYCKPYKMSWII